MVLRGSCDGREGGVGRGETGWAKREGERGRGGHMK
jgi:hypothetical protein